MRIAMIGLGKMGSAMAQRLMECGHHLVVWNRSPEKATALVAAGATLATSARAAVQDSEVAISSLFDASVLTAVYLGEGGLTSGPLDGKLLIEMSTVRPNVQRELAAAVEARGGAMIDCPVGGTTGPAKQGKLLGLVGGDAADVARAMPILEQLCRRVEHIGPHGAGSAMKLAINLPLAVYWQAMGEAMALVRDLGKDTSWMIDLFCDTSGAANALKARGPAVAAALAGGDGGMATFDLGGIAKDLSLMVAEARDKGFDVPVAAAAQAVYDQAVADGYATKDTCWVPSYWARKGDA
ncbi:MAG: NAD(P)-dependent oxidoreductase [Acetobacteraceae bacterium]|nr:NAD(P)-dependent oxidoreductase [Acetobacteraceae bacterium]